MVSFEIFVKSMPPSLSELKVLPSFCFAFKIPDNVTASNMHACLFGTLEYIKGHLFFQFNQLLDSRAEIHQIFELSFLKI